MPKFKKGDEVVACNSGKHCYLWQGTVYIYDETKAFYVVQFNTDDFFCFKEEDLKLYINKNKTPSTQFKNGDEVVTCNSKKDYWGWRGTVYRYDKARDLYNVQFNKDTFFWYKEDDLKLYGNKTPSPQFKIGDIVKINSLNNEHDQINGVINSYDPYKDIWCVLFSDNIDSWCWYGPDELELVARKDLHVPGAKDDADKPPVALLFESFPNALLAISKVAGDGAKKYTRDGWVRVDNGYERYLDAAGRHFLKLFVDGDNDPESGSPHLAHCAWNVLACLELKIKGNER